MSNLRIACISDAPSPLTTSGFGNVSAKIYEGFHKAGYDLYVFGMLHATPDIKRELPYSFWPTTGHDLMGYMESMNFVLATDPDIVWIMVDPGNLLRWTANLLELKKQKNMHFKIVAYPPIEGTPVSGRFLSGFNSIREDGGDVVFWCEAAAKSVSTRTGEDYSWIYFGNDHAPWERYSNPQRDKLRDNAGFTDHFIVGSVGVNKRTKGFDTLIYAAAHLRETKQDEGIKFYCHTEPNRPTMQGYNLIDLAQAYNVSNMFLWKPTNNLAATGSDYRGIVRSKPNLEQLLNTERPQSIGDRVKLWDDYSFISRLNCLDIYMDTSQVEGWQLPTLESMACGVPTFIPRDNHVRDEIHAGGSIQYEPLPEHLWTTWHTGARLVGIDPVVVAELIVDAKNKGLNFSANGIEHTSQFKWEDTQKAMCKLVEEIYANVS